MFIRLFTFVSRSVNPIIQLGRLSAVTVGARTVRVESWTKGAAGSESPLRWCEVCCCCVAMLLLLLLWCCCSVAAVGPDITARDRLVKDLPNGVFAGRKLTPKVETIEKERTTGVMLF